MAFRYAVASGNFSSTSVWSTTPTGSAGASVPGTSDVAVINKSGVTVNATADVHVTGLEIDKGTFNDNVHNVTIDGTLVSFAASSGAATLNLTGNTTINTAININVSTSYLNLTISRATINISSSFGTDLYFGDFTYGDVTINLSDDGSNPTNLHGNPTFRLLDIRSANSGAHTVEFDSSATITADKFIGIGSSSSNKLTIKPSSGTSTIDFTTNGTSYGQFVDMQATASGSGVPKYIGSNSTQSSGMGWLTQDPPKISTLVDPLTTDPTSNPNWTVTGTITKVTTGFGGGGYQGTEGDSMVSTDTYDLSESEFTIEVSGAPTGTDVRVDNIIGDDVFSARSYVSYSDDERGFTLWLRDTRLESEGLYDTPVTGKSYERYSLYSGVIKAELSLNGIDWTTYFTRTLTADEVTYLRSVRIKETWFSNDTADIGSINPSLKPPSSGNFLAFF